MELKLLFQWPLYVFAGSVVLIACAASYCFHAQWADRYLEVFARQDDPGPYFCS